jgi:hypothetical protein
MPKKGCSYGDRTRNGRCPSQKKYGPKTKRAFNLEASRKSLLAKRPQKSSRNNEYYNAYRQRRVKMLKQDAMNDKHGRNDVDAYVQRKLDEDFPKSYDDFDEEEKELAKQLYADPSYTGRATYASIIPYKKRQSRIYME